MEAKRIPALCKLMIAGILLFSTFLATGKQALAQEASETTWIVETVDAGGGDLGCFAMNVSLALDSEDRPHVSYYGDTVLMYAYRTGDGWEKTVVDDTENVGRSSSIAIDSTDKPHIAYRELGLTFEDSLKYASWDGTEWNLTVAGTAGWFPSLALDSTDQPHISYLGNEPQIQVPSYAYRVGEQWQNSVIENTFSSSGMSLALDSFERPHVVYNSDWDLNYGIYADTTWITETVDSSNSRTPAYPSIVLDSADNPHISYQYNGDLKYAYKMDDAWQEELPDTRGEVGDFSAIALDTQEYPRISYFDATNQAVKHAQWNGSSWLVTVVDSPVAMSMAGYTSLAVDQDDNSHIFYCDGDSSTVRYARQVTLDNRLFLPVVSGRASSPE